MDGNWTVEIIIAKITHYPAHDAPPYQYLKCLGNSNQKRQPTGSGMRERAADSSLCRWFGLAFRFQIAQQAVKSFPV
jgi:hypothetical protein